MKKVYAYISLCCLLAACQPQGDTGSDIPLESDTEIAEDTQNTPSEPAATPTEAIATPEGYTLLGEASGDLDKDGTDEKVVVYNTPRSTDFGDEREIHIHKAKDGAWTLWHKSTGAVLPSEHGGMMGDPFEGVAVENGCVVFNHFGGSRDKWHYTHRFRHQNDGWELIGTTIEFGMPCDSWETYDYNLSNGKIVYEKESQTCEDDGDPKVKTEEKKDFSHKMDKLPQMDGFYPGDSELKIADSGTSFYY